MKTLAWMTKRLSAHPPSAPKPVRCRLVVQESGSDTIPADLGGTDWEETIVLPAEDSRVPMRLVCEVAGRVAAMERRHVVVGCAALAVSTSTDAQTVAARELIARALLSHLTQAGAGELVLVAPGASPELRDQMLSLVGTLLEALESQAVTIRVHFHTEPRVTTPPVSEVRLARPVEAASEAAS